MGGNRVKFPLLICTADKSSTVQTPTAFSTDRAHVGPSSACLQKAEVILLSPAPFMPPSWKKSSSCSVARDKSFQLLHQHGHRSCSWWGTQRVSYQLGRLLPPATEKEQAVASSRRDPKLTEPLTFSYFHQQHDTKLQYSKPSSPLGPPMYPLPFDQKVHLHCISLGLFQQG